MDNKHDHATDTKRRHFLRISGTVGGVVLLSACGGGDNDSPATVATPSPTPTPTPTPSPGPAYTANDVDRLNFLLQVNYLVGVYFARGVLGEALPTAMTGGVPAGALLGGTQVLFADALEASMMREIAYDLQAQIMRLRAVLGTAATAQPVITIAGGPLGPFQAIASTEDFPSATPFDPYASAELLLVGALTLTSLRSSVFTEMVRLMTDRRNTATVAGLSAIASQHDATVRQILWARGRSQAALYGRLDRSSDARERFDGIRDYDQSVGNLNGANFTVTDAEAVTLRRSPEQVLNVLYATQSATSSGGFFPAGVNGLIRFSGANTI